MYSSPTSINKTIINMKKFFFWINYPLFKYVYLAYLFIFQQPNETRFARSCLSQSYLSCKENVSGQVYELFHHAVLSTNIKFTQMAFYNPSAKPVAMALQATGAGVVSWRSLSLHPHIGRGFMIVVFIGELTRGYTEAQNDASRHRPLLTLGNCCSKSDILA